MRFPASVQSGPGAHPASYKMGTGCFLEIKRPVHVLDHPSKAKVEEGVELYLYSLSGNFWPLLVRISLYFIL